MKTAFPRFPNVVNIRLYANIPFDNTYKHHTIISDLFTYNNVDMYSKGGDTIAKEQFIDRKTSLNAYYYPRWDKTDEYNFNFSNGLVANITLELTPEQTNANYLRVKVGNNTNGYDYYYYFVTSITEVNTDTYTLQLELDVIMTYQDEFLDGMKDVPVFTTRKHSYRYCVNSTANRGKIPHCADLLGNEETFSGVKPEHIIKVKELKHKYVASKFNLITWLYVCVDLSQLEVTDPGEIAKNIMYASHYMRFPMAILAIPINVNKFKIYDTDGTTLIRERNYATISRLVYKLIGDGSCHGAKISKYPPFPYKANMTYDEVNNELSIILDSWTSAPLDNNTGGVLGVISDTTFYFTLNQITQTDVSMLLWGLGTGIAISNEGNGKHEYEGISGFDLKITESTAPDIMSARKEDIKLKFSPFTEYSLMGAYTGEGAKLFPELFYGNVVGSTTTESIYDFITIHSTYIGDNNLFTYPKAVSYTYNSVSYTPYPDHNLNKTGLAVNMNYIVPVGTNALDVFNASQATAFYESKIASGIGSSVGIGAGIASIAIGAAAMTGSKTIGSAMIASGIATIVGSVAGAVDAVASSVAKVHDLKKTPDSINISGSSYTTDMAITGNTAMPYILVSECSLIVKHSADDFFYNYGYQVARECFFNTEMKYVDATGKIDNNLFGRTIFNYVQLNEDLTNKIKSNIPLIIKQKFTSIFNSGITLWSFFGFTGLWTTGTDSNYDPDKWFMKCTLDNTEYTIQTENN